MKTEAQIKRSILWHKKKAKENLKKGRGYVSAHHESSYKILEWVLE